MQGKVLGFDASAESGAIKGEDGRRYAFSRSDWKASGIPAVNDEVDFEPVETRATEIFTTRATTSLNFEAIGQSVDIEKFRDLGALFLATWHPLLAFLTIIACFWTFMSAGGPAGTNLPGFSPNLFGAPDAIKRGLDAMNGAMGTMQQLGQLGQNSSAPAPNLSGLSSFADLAYLVFLIPLGSAAILVQAVRRIPATKLAVFTGALCVVLPLSIYFALSMVVSTALKDVNEMMRSMGQTGYRVEMNAGGWTLVVLGLANLALGLGFIRSKPSDFLSRPTTQP